MNRRDLFKATFGIVAARVLPIPAPPTGLAAWLPNTNSQFFGVDRSAACVLKAIWTEDRIESTVYGDNPFLELLPR